MANRSISDRLTAIEEKENKLKQQKKKLKAEQAKQARNARTKRLIEIGAEVESVLGRPIEREELPKLRAFLQQQEDRGRFFSKWMNDANR